MLSINETFISLNHRLSSIEDKQILCVVNIEFWLRIHLFITLLSELFFVYVYFLLLFICVIMFLFTPRWYPPVRVIIVNTSLWISEKEERYSYRIETLICFLPLFIHDLDC